MAATEEKLTIIDIDEGIREMASLLMTINEIRCAISRSKTMNKITEAYPYSFGKYLEEASVYFCRASEMLEGIRRRMSRTYTFQEPIPGQNWVDD